MFLQLGTIFSEVMCCMSAHMLWWLRPLGSTRAGADDTSGLLGHLEPGVAPDQRVGSKTTSASVGCHYSKLVWPSEEIVMDVNECCFYLDSISNLLHVMCCCVRDCRPKLLASLPSTAQPRAHLSVKIYNQVSPPAESSFMSQMCMRTTSRNAGFVQEERVHHSARA